VVAGGLAETLSGPGPFTVFAPDNFAFERLPPGALPKILANKTLLVEILTCKSRASRPNHRAP
jgi:uncharacterized surface protein with fasciclin (FAS1) repeats